MLKYLLMRYLLGLLILPFLILPAYTAGELPKTTTANLRYSQTIDLQRTTRQPNALVADTRFIYVTDKTGGLYKYDAEGSLLTELNRINNEFFIAGGLGQDSEYLYLTDELSKGIIKINKKMDLSDAHKIQTAGLEFINPAGILIGPNQDIYISDSANDQVYCLNALGLLEWRRGMFGEAMQNFNTPRALAMYGNTPVVLDTGNDAVKKITPERITLLADYPGLLSLAGRQDKLFIGTKEGIYFYPSGELLDTPEAIYPEALFILDDRLYVLDSQQRKILIYEIY